MRRNTSTATAVLAASALLGTVTASLVASAQPRQDDRGVLSYSNIVEPAKRSVVWIVCNAQSGSGTILDKDGYILTNAHVLKGTSGCRATLEDGREIRDFEIIGFDEFSDVGLAKIKASELTPMPIGDSRSLKVGDVVFAVGTPIEYFQSVTVGIVSGLGRVRTQGNPFDFQELIQTDAAIFHGNSGGALIDSKGRLVGIPSASELWSYASDAFFNVAGLNFAIPINFAMPIVEQLKKYREVRRGFIGASTRDLTPALSADDPAVKANLGDTNVRRGAVVAYVADGSPAAEAGLRRADVVVSANAIPISNENDLRNVLAVSPPGSDLILGILRGGREQTVKVRVAATTVAGDSTPAVLGATFSEVPAAHAVANRLVGQNIMKREQAASVVKVETNSPAARAGLQVDDLVLKINGRPLVWESSGKTVSGAASVRNLVAAVGELIVLSIVRGNSVRWTELRR